MADQTMSLGNEARATLNEARELFQAWHDRWQADSGQGYSGTDEALVDVDRLLQELERVGKRWRALTVPADQADVYAACGEAIDDLVDRIEELLGALDAQELERMRMLSQAVELIGHRLTELIES